MNKIVHQFLASLFISFLAFGIQAQSAADMENTSMLPKVFVIGDFQDEYESLFNVYPDILITACLSDIDTAQSAWFSYMKAMEDYSKEIEFDLGGTAFWVNVFWNPQGEVEHIAYHLQAHSRFIKDDLMLAFLRSFARVSDIGVTSDKPFNHFGSSSFPLYFQRQNPTYPPPVTDKQK